MGKTALSGPAYGAKSLLWMAHRDNPLSGATDTTTQLLQSVQVPTYEDWFVTEFKAFRGSSGSTAITTTYLLTDDSTTIGSLVTASSVAGLMLSTTLTPDPGEFEGVRVAANSTLAVTVGHGGSSEAISSDVTTWVYGYIRYVDSTRAV
jgi:hypothetical protein